MAKTTEVPGNAVLSQQVLDREVAKVGVAIFRLESMTDKLRDEGVDIKVIKIRAPGGRSGDWLAIVTASSQEGEIIAFHGSDSLAGALKGLARRLADGSLKWKDDEYAGK